MPKENVKNVQAKKSFFGLELQSVSYHTVLLCAVAILCILYAAWLWRERRLSTPSPISNFIGVPAAPTHHDAPSPMSPHVVQPTYLIDHAPQAVCPVPHVPPITTNVVHGEVSRDVEDDTLQRRSHRSRRRSVSFDNTEINQNIENTMPDANLSIVPLQRSKSQKRHRRGLRDDHQTHLYETRSSTLVPEFNFYPSKTVAF
jgi:hypothetical protein